MSIESRVKQRVNNRKTAILAIYITLLLTLPLVFGTKISETSLSELGYETTITSEEKCKTFDFSTTTLKDGEYFIISLHAEFLPAKDSEALIGIYLNNEHLEDYYAEDFDNDWARITVDKNLLTREKNTLEACIAPTKTSLRIVLHNDSLLGTYLQPDFTGNLSFTKSLSKTEIFPGDETEVAITLKNYGSLDSEISISHSSGDMDTSFPYIKIVKGELNKNATIEKCKSYDDAGKCSEPGTVELKYTMKSEKAIDMLLFPATATYTNIFGERITIKSNRIPLRVKKPELMLKAGLYSENNEMTIGKEKEITFRIENKSKYAVYTLKAGISTNNQKCGESKCISGIQASESTIDAVQIAAGGKFEKTITITADRAGKNTVSCTLFAEDYNNEEIACSSLEIIVKEEDNMAWLAAGGIMAATGIAVYIYFARKKVPE